MKRVLFGLAFIIGGLLAIYYLGSGTVAERALSHWLTEQGIAFKDISVRSANMRGANVGSITLGKGDNIILKDADIGYTIEGTENAKLRYISIGSATIDTANANGAWDLGGLETYLKLPAFDETKREGAARLRYQGGVKAEMLPQGAKLSAHEGKISYSTGDITVNADVTEATLTPTDAQGVFDIAVNAKNIVVTNGNETWTTPLTLTATGKLEGDVLTFQGQIADAESKLPLILNGHQNSKEKKLSVQWTNAGVTFAPGGLQPAVLSPQLAEMPALDMSLRMEGSYRQEGEKKPRYTQIFTLTRAALSPLLKLAFKDDISVTGDLAGTIPLSWSSGEFPQIRNAKLASTAPGTLIYDPLTGASTALEGQGQAELLLQALRKFDYTALTIGADSKKDGTLKASFNIKGSNKDFFAGRAVDFTLNINGNLKSLLESQREIDDIIKHQ